MRIEQLDPGADVERLRACHQIVEAGRQADDPRGPPWSLRAFGGWLAHGSAGEPARAWLATGPDGDQAGCCVLELPERENRHLAWCLIVVRPDRRRRGIGTALLAHCADQALRAGRVLLTSETREGSAGTHFARAHGARPGVTEVRRVLDLDAGLPRRLSALEAAALPRAAGYSLLSWRGPVPGEHLGQVAAVSAAIGDAPRSAGTEPEQWDAARLRAVEDGLAAQGLQTYAVAARHDRSGEFAALTQLATDPGTPGWAFQAVTAVTRSHRGHRLGLLVKVALLQRLVAAEPGVRRVETLNADSNEHMIAINELLGFRVCDRFPSFELDVTAPAS